jgi:ribosomal-protein-alanine N-acetyltransferase
MRVEHIPFVTAIEKRCFPIPWPSNSYRKELQNPKTARYMVMRHVDADAMVALTAPSAATPSFMERLARWFRPQDEPTPATPAETAPGRIIGYVGLWLFTEEAHITTIAVDPDYQGRGLGELLLLHVIDDVLGLGSRWLTLEVRVSNDRAQALYRKYTFKEVGRRRRYYTDNGEDALVMWTEPMDSEEFRTALTRNRAALEERFDGQWEPR